MTSTSILLHLGRGNATPAEPPRAPHSARGADVTAGSALTGQCGAAGVLAAAGAALSRDPRAALDPGVQRPSVTVHPSPRAVAHKHWPPRGRRQLVLDGKTLRASDRAGLQPVAALQVVTRSDGTHRGPLAPLAIPPGRDERAVAQQLIAGQDLRGGLLSADALHPQRAWCQQVRAQGGDDRMLATANQPQLRTEIAERFQAPWPPWLAARTARRVDKGHGRLEVRQERASTGLADWLAPTWTDVAQVFQLHRTVTRHGTTRHEVVSGLTSLPPVAAGADRFLDLTRQDWSSENRVHWRRDVTWQEDACQGRAGPAALVFAILNTAVLALLDRLGTASLPATMRAVMANPTPALALLLSNPNF